MTRQALLKRLAELEAEKNRLLSDANAYHGAIQEVTYWLAQVKEDGDAQAPTSN